MFSTISRIDSIITRAAASLIGTNWTMKESTLLAGYQYTTNGNQNGTMVEMSTDGTYICAVAQSAGKIVISTNGGTSFSVRNNTHGLPATYNPTGCAVSASGAIMYVSMANGSVWKSTNNGANWSQLGALPGPPASLFSIVCSSDGTKVLTSMCTADATNGNKMYLSQDSGATFTNIGGTVLGSNNNYWTSYAISPDGTKIFGSSNSTGIVYYTGNLGSSWSTSLTQSGAAWGQIVCENTGKACITTRTGNNGVFMFNGTSWSGVSTSIIPADKTQNVACSDDMSIILVAQCKASGNGVLFISRDGGTTWFNLQTQAGISFWQAVGVSPNGKQCWASGSSLNSKNGLLNSFN